MTEGFGPKVGGFDHFKFGDHQSLKKAISNKTAAVMVEPIMGEGGIKVIPDWCLKELRKICNKKQNSIENGRKEGWPNSYRTAGPKQASRGLQVVLPCTLPALKPA